MSGRPHHRPVWVVPTVLLLAACSSSSLGSTATSPPNAEDDGLTVVEQYTALEPSAREDELRRLSATVERQLVTVSGLEHELGGAAAAGAAYAALSRALVGGLEQTTGSRSFGRFGGSVPAADQPSIGGLMFGNFMIAGLGAEAVVSSTNEVPAGGAPAVRSGADQDDPGSSRYTVTATVAEAKLEAGATITVDGMTGKVGTVVTVAPCPDATGQFTSTTAMSAAVSAAGGGTGASLTIDVEITGRVDDDARLVSFDIDSRTQSAGFANSKGQFVDVSTGWTNTGGKQDNYRSKVNRTGGEVTAPFVDDQLRWGLLTAVMMQDKAVEAARKGWESGRCVVLEPTTDPAKRTGLAPAASLMLVAPPRSKLDGSPVGGTVTATLAGGTSVHPAATKVAADATFTVIAPGARKKKSTVVLEARSRRGVARAEVVVDTRQASYTASGKAGNISFRGTVADLTRPFTISGAGGARLTFSYTPSSADGRSGRMTFEGDVGGYELSGRGGYSIAGDEGGVLVLTQGSEGCTAGPLGCIGGVATITMTPAP